ncbi:hypothetical protein GCM10009872_62810 [Actinopolymorpha rutila]
MAQDNNHAAEKQHHEHVTDDTRPSDFGQALKAHAHHLATQAHRQLEDLGYIGPDHPFQGGPHCWSADRHRPANADEPDEAAGPDR